MTEAIATRAQKLYHEAGEIVAEEVKLKQKSNQHIVRLAKLLTDLYEVFLRREDQNEKLVLTPKSPSIYRLPRLHDRTPSPARPGRADWMVLCFHRSPPVG